MSRLFKCCVYLSFFLSPALASGQSEPARKLIVKVDPGDLPENARLRLGRLGGFRYDGSFGTAAMSPDGARLAVASKDGNGITVLDPVSGKVIQRMQMQLIGGQGAMTFSGDGGTLAIQTFQGLHVWDVATGKELQQLKQRNIAGRGDAPALSRDGKILGVGSDRIGGVNQKEKGEIKAFDVTTGKEIGVFETIHNFNTRVAMAPDGTLMASWGQHLARGGAGGFDRDAPRTLQLWDLVAGKELKQIKLEFGPQGFGQLARATFSPDGKTIAVMSGRSTFHLIDVETGKETRRFAGHGAIGGGMGGLRFSPDGDILADFDAGGVVQAWEVKSGKRVELEDGPKAQILDVAFPGKGRIVTLANLAQSLYWWDANLSAASPFQGHLAAVTGLAFLPDGKSVISAGSDHTVLWWDLQTGKEQRRLQLPDEDARFAGINRGGSVTLAPNGRYAATSSSILSSGVRLWNLKTARALFDFEGPRSGFQLSLAFAPDGSKLVGADSQTPYLWDITTGQEIPTLPRQANARNFGGGGARVAISPDGKILALQAQQFNNMGGQNFDLILWDIPQAKEIHRSARAFINVNVAGAGAMGGIAFSADGRLLALAEGGGGIALLNARTGKEMGRIASNNPNSSLHLAFSPDGRFLAAGVVPQNRVGVANATLDAPVVEIWELASGQLRTRFAGHSGGVTCLAFSPDGATLASGSMDTTILLWDVAGTSGKKLPPLADAELAAAWQTLATKDGKLDATIRRLVQTPATTAFLKKHLEPAKSVKVDDEALEKLVADLDSSNFQKRQAATKELIRLGERAATVLDQALEQKPSIEATRRMQEVLDTIARREPTPAELQAIRAVEILERIDTVEARALLTALSKGDSAARTTQEAAAALKRLVWP
jgi:WD40 repeat protein